jgi:hypothetical protein
MKIYTVFHKIEQASTLFIKILNKNSIKKIRSQEYNTNSIPQNTKQTIKLSNQPSRGLNPSHKDDCSSIDAFQVSTRKAQKIKV